MRFISHIRKFGVGILTRRAENTLGGEIELVPGYVAQFQQGDIEAAELEFAERRWPPGSTNGRTYEADQVTPTKLLGRLSTYDSESEMNLREYDRIDEFMDDKPIPGDPKRKKWTPGTMKRLVEEKLLERAERSHTFALFTPAPVSPPWPTYDAFNGSISELVDKIVADGYHLPQVIAYERQAQGRRDVLAGLEMALAEHSAEQPEFVS